ncbi:TPA: hypothetical protein ACYHN3_002750 [Vibrio cholerae]
MEIISHRGYWLNNIEKNTLTAFERSFKLNYGTETDVRDLNGTLVISHDTPVEGCITFDEFINLYNSYGITATLAINIKSDGLQDKLVEILQNKKITNYFIFDMSIPDHIVSLDKGLTTLSRYSEYESSDLLLQKSKGMWYDMFHSELIDHKLVGTILDSGKIVCIVSSELHGLDHKTQWEAIKKLPSCYRENQNLILCTDFPEQAKVFFYGE